MNKTVECLWVCILVGCLCVCVSCWMGSVLDGLSTREENTIGSFGWLWFSSCQAAHRPTMHRSLNGHNSLINESVCLCVSLYCLFCVQAFVYFVHELLVSGKVWVGTMVACVGVFCDYGWFNCAEGGCVYVCVHMCVSPAGKSSWKLKLSSSFVYIPAYCRTNLIQPAVFRFFLLSLFFL